MRHYRLETEILFQFTHPGGVRLKRIYKPADDRQFQFTHPGGVRRNASFCATIIERFNSRTREGCDYYLRLGRPRPLGFNSRTREGCDRSAPYKLDIS